MVACRALLAFSASESVGATDLDPEVVLPPRARPRPGRNWQCTAGFQRAASSEPPRAAFVALQIALVAACEPKIVAGLPNPSPRPRNPKSLTGHAAPPHLRQAVPAGSTARRRAGRAAGRWVGPLAGGGGGRRQQRHGRSKACTWRAALRVIDQQPAAAPRSPGPAGGWAAARGFSTDADSHDDFKPQVKASGSAGSVDASIEQDIAGHEVFIYMKARRRRGGRRCRSAAGPVAPRAGKLAPPLAPLPNVPPAPSPRRLPCSRSAGRAAGPHVRLLQHGLRHPQPVRCARLLASMAGVRSGRRLPLPPRLPPGCLAAWAHRLPPVLAPDQLS